MSGAFVNVVDAIDNPKAPTPGDSSSLTKLPEPVDTIPVDTLPPADTLITADTTIGADTSNGESKDDKVYGTIAEAAKGIHHVDMGSSILFTTESYAKWAIFDVNGHMVGSASGKNFVWKTQNRKGVYIVKAASRNGNYMKKIAVR